MTRHFPFGFFLLILIGLLGLPKLAASQRGAGLSYGFTHRGIHQGIRPGPSQPVYPPRRDLPLYNPYFSIYFGPLYEEYDEPCYYDEYYGQWVGPCDTSLDTPGYSITVPNRIR